MGAVKLQSVGAGSIQTSFEGLMRLSGEQDAGLRLSKGDRGLVGQSRSHWGQDRLTHQCPLLSPMSCLWHNLLVVVHMRTIQSIGECYNPLTIAPSLCSCKISEFLACLAPLLSFLSCKIVFQKWKLSCSTFMNGADCVVSVDSG